jgi:type III pantothenate kinase
MEMAPEDPMIIATGGMAGLIAPYAPSIKAVLPMLTLDGLRLLYERNR